MNLPDARVLLCGPAMNAAESAASLDLLGRVDLPEAAKFVVTTGKFDARKAARPFNIEADYPPQPAHLQTLARCAEIPPPSDDILRDGYDLFCMSRLIGKNDGFDFAVLLRDEERLEDRWSDLRLSVDAQLFVTFGRLASQSEVMRNVLFALRAENAGPFLEFVVDLYLSGAAYAIADYSLEKALRFALAAFELEQKIDGELESVERRSWAVRQSRRSARSKRMHPHLNTSETDRSISA